jgi:beta-glucosidase
MTPGPKGEAEVTFDLRNAGDVPGSEVAQLYTHQEKSALLQPIKSLRAFERVFLEPGETKTIRFRVPAQQLAFYDVTLHDFRIEPGEFDILVGSSSEDLRLRGSLQMK